MAQTYAGVVYVGWGQIQMPERSVINHTGFRAFESDPETLFRHFGPCRDYMFKAEVLRQFFDP